MPFDGSGNFTPSAAPNFPAVGGTVISPTYYNTVINDIATGLSNCLTRDGQGKPSSAIDWNAKNLTNVGALSASSLTLSSALGVAYGGLGGVTVPTNGYVPIGSGGVYTPAAITGSGGITITLGAGTIDVSSSGLLPKAGGTMTGKLNALASAAVAGAGFNLGSGVAPNSPTDGDMWITTTGLYARVNGTTQGPFFNSTGFTLTGQAVFAANSTSLVPIKMQSGSLATTPVSGGLEYNGRVFTKSFSTTDRLLDETAMCFTQSGIPAVSGGKVFSSLANGAITLPVGNYILECGFSFVGLSGGNTLTINFDGTAVGNVNGNYYLSKGSAVEVGVFNGASIAGSATATTAGTAGTTGSFSCRLYLVVTTAGTLIPKVSVSGGGLASNYGSFMFVVPLTSGAGDANFGNWS